MPIAWIGGIFLFLTSHPSDLGFQIGVPIALAGMLMRVWASGFIERKSQELATSGPFAYVRNPLYLGNFLIGLGIVVVVQSWLGAVLFFVGFGILYHGTIHKEETNLKQTFGEPYRQYLTAVPRYLPRLTPYAGGKKTGFHWKLLWKHRELETLLALLLVLVGLYLWENIFWGGTVGWKEIVSLGAGLVFVCGLIAENLIRSYQRSRGSKKRVS